MGRKAFWGPALFMILALLAGGCRMAPRPAEVTVALEEDLLGLDPHRHDENLTFAVMDNIYNHLVEFDDQMRIVPGLALSWENPDENTWRFHLRPGVKFHNGTPCDAADIAFSLERARHLDLGHYLATVSQVRVVDGLTLEIITKKPSPVLLNKLTFIAIVPQGQPDTISSPVGTGPYRFLEYRKGQDLLLEANRQYWGGKPRIPRIRICFYPDHQQRLEGLVSGRVQLARDIRQQELQRMAGSEKINLTTTPGLSVGFLGMNIIRGGPLARREVREAIYWAVDPVSWIERIDLDAQPSHQFVAPFVVGYLPDHQPTRPDLNRARMLLKKAGYPRGFATVLEVTQAAVNRSAPVIVEQLGKVGIKVNLRVLTWAELSERISKRKSPFFFVGWGCSSGDASDFLDACLHTPNEQNYGSANWTGYSNREMDRLIEQIGSTLDNRQRLVLMQRAMALALQDYPMVPVYARSRVYAHCRELGYTPRLDGSLNLFSLRWR